MDMAATRANSPGTIPSISGTSDVDVTPLPSSVPALIIIHAVCLAGSFLLLFPLGVVALRWFGRIRWHWMLQVLATLVCIVGLAIAIAFSVMDPEYVSFNEAHQIIGIVVVAALIIQVGLGYFHHKSYQRLGRRSWISHSHLWMGRVAMILGMVNAVLYVKIFPLSSLVVQMLITRLT